MLDCAPAPSAPHTGCFLLARGSSLWALARTARRLRSQHASCPATGRAEGKPATSPVPSPIARPTGALWPPGGAWGKTFLRIGHGGAAGHAPANTLRSLGLALQMGVDMVEFDVRPCRDALVLLHDDKLTQVVPCPCPAACILYLASRLLLTATCSRPRRPRPRHAPAGQPRPACSPTGPDTPARAAALVSG